jgi:hypothetical protein
MLSFLEIPVGFRKILDFLDLAFSSRVMTTKESIDLLSGTLFVGPKTRGDLELRCLN